MKAIALVPHTKNVDLIDWPEPKIETATQVKVRVLEVGICGTDREEVSGGRADAPMGEKVLIIGHEMVGVVVQIGTQVRSLKVGDHVVIMVRRPCGECPMCKKECADMCASGKYKERGIKELHGFHAEFVVDEEKYAIQAPAQMKHLAVLTEPTTVVVKAIDHACRIQVGRLPVDPDPKKYLSHKKVLIAGLGPIGLLAAMVALLRGAEVTGMDIVDPQSLRPKILGAMGGKYQKSVKGQKFDLIIDAAGIAKLDFELTQYLAANGIFALAGVAEEGAPISVNGARVAHDLVMENQVIFGSVNASAQHFRQAVSDLESASKKWPGVIEQIITSKTPYAQFTQVLQKRKADEIKAVIQWA